MAADDLLHAIVRRAKLYASLREFFAARRVIEVETPILWAAANTDPNIESFTTRFSGHVAAGRPERWMRTSSEFFQKRLLAAGIGNCYEIGRVFRNGEAGRQHNPEFTMLEWYRLGWNHLQLIDETLALLEMVFGGVGKKMSVERTTYRNLFLSMLGIDPFLASIDELQAPLSQTKIDEKNLLRDDWLDLLLTHCIQPRFPHDRMTVVYDYPASQCALAKIRRESTPVAERFEIYVGRHELANGYHELTDADEQRARFEEDNKRRRNRGQSEMPIDENLLAAIARGLPSCAGVALGIERLLMAMLDTDEIGDVIAFPFASA